MSAPAVREDVQSQPEQQQKQFQTEEEIKKEKQQKGEEFSQEVREQETSKEAQREAQTEVPVQINQDEQQQTSLVLPESDFEEVRPHHEHFKAHKSHTVLEGIKTDPKCSRFW
jgi:hypothetical protein